jgi:endonuclease/exonuclease/phosphatase family metal-dependent hydrolase
MSYNIERGFHSRDHKLEKERLTAAQRAVQEINPDILAITEACYGGENSQGVFIDYQKIFDFSYGQFGGYPIFGPRKGDEGGNCLLSQYPMDAEAISLAFKGAVRAKIGLEDTVLTIDVVHPSYTVDDAEKIKTLEPLVLNRKSPYILTGDFNTVNSEDSYDWDLQTKEIMKFDPKRAKAVIENWQRAELVSWLSKLNLRDSFPPEKRESTVPTSYTYGEPKAGVRMDFFFVSPDIEIIDSYVLKNRNTEIASDHYPIVGVFDIK